VVWCQLLDEKAECDELLTLIEPYAQRQKYLRSCERGYDWQLETINGRKSLEQRMKHLGQRLRMIEALSTQRMGPF